MITGETSLLLEQIQVWIADYGLRIITALMLYIVGRYLARMLRSIVLNASTRARMDPNLVAFAGNVSYYGVLVLVLMAILGQLGIATASLLAVMGAAGLAIGLALQGSLTNFAAGLLIVFFHPFRVGDLIEGNGVVGVVEDIEVLTTVVRTPNNRMVTIPNSALTENNITNLSRKGTARVDMNVRLDYSADIERAKRVIGEILASDSRVLKQPAPELGVLDLAESGVVLAVRPWAKINDLWPVRFATLETIKQRFDQEQIRLAGAVVEVAVESESLEALSLLGTAGMTIDSNSPAA